MGGPLKQMGDEKLRPLLPYHMCDLLSICFRSKRMPTAFGAPDGEQAPVQSSDGDRLSRWEFNIFYLQ